MARFHLSWSSLLLYLMALCISWSLASILSLTDHSNKERNDLINYEAHYDCMDSSISSFDRCQSLIGNPADFAYEVLVFFSKLIFLGEEFNLFLLFFSFLVYFYILRFSIKFTTYSLIPIFFLLSDFRFYELGSNILRNGLAVIFLIMIVEANRNKISGFLPVSAHFSSFPYFFSFKRPLGVWIYFALFLLSLALSNSMGAVFSVASNIPFDALKYKVIAYSDTVSTGYSGISKRYLLFFLAGLFFLPKLKGDFRFVVCFNVFFVFFCASVLFSAFGFSYRFLNYAVPFLAVFIGRIFDYLVSRVGVYGAAPLSVVTSSLFFFLFLSDFQAISRGFFSY